MVTGIMRDLPLQPTQVTFMGHSYAAGRLAAPSLAGCGRTLSAMASLILATLGVWGTEWPAYRGPAGDGRSTETLLRTWPEGGPTRVWTAPTTGGFSSFSVSGGRAFTLVRRAVDGVDREVCVALDADTGAEQWATPVGMAKYDGGGDSGAASNKGGDGPRSTPAVAAGRVYVFNAQLVLLCLDAVDGSVRWQRDLVREHEGRNIAWQNAASPALDEGLVFVGGGGPGQSLLGIDQEDGRVVWKTGDEKITHATPVVATLHGVRQVIFLAQSGLVSADAGRGQVLWRYPFKFNVSTAASPVVAGTLVYCSAGYGVGATVIRVGRTAAGFGCVELWRQRGDREVANHWSTPVHHRGYLYGMFSFKEYGEGPLKCVEISTGRVVWQEEGFGAGNVILAGDDLLALTDAGELLCVEASPEGYRPRGRLKVVDGKCWSTPALAGGRVYVRSTTQGACLDVGGDRASR